MVKPADPFAYVHGHVPTDSDDARHDMRWQTVRWVLRHANQVWSGKLSNPGPNGYDPYMEGTAWEMEPERVLVDLLEIAARCQLWKDQLNDDLANTQSTYESITRRRVEKWNEVAFEDLFNKVNERGWFALDESEVWVERADILDFGAHQARLRERLDAVLERQMKDAVEQALHRDWVLSGSW